MLSGDLHATGHVQITTSGEIELTRPVNGILARPLGTGTAWPSAIRGTPPLVASELAVNPLADVEEKNGFTLVDMTPEKIELSLFRWRRGEPEENIDGLHAYQTYSVSHG